jgi:hypothetical protein
LIDRALPWLWWLGAPILAGVILFLAGRDAVPAFTAQFGSGVPGAFTATERNCGRSCTFQGDFVSDDGSLIRRDVGVAPGGELSRVGDRVPAEDTGHPYIVYPQAGSWDWLLVAVLGTVSVLTLAAWAWSVMRAIRRRRA